MGLTGRQPDLIDQVINLRSRVRTLEITNTDADNFLTNVLYGTRSYGTGVPGGTPATFTFPSWADSVNNYGQGYEDSPGVYHDSDFQWAIPGGPTPFSYAMQDTGLSVTPGAYIMVAGFLVARNSIDIRDFHVTVGQYGGPLTTLMLHPTIQFDPAGTGFASNAADVYDLKTGALVLVTDGTTGQNLVWSIASRSGGGSTADMNYVQGSVIWIARLA